MRVVAFLLALLPAASAQADCNPGSVWNGQACAPCPPGTRWVSEQPCHPCEPGSYSASQGSLDCSPCPEGSTSDAGASQCYPINNGGGGSGGDDGMSHLGWLDRRDIPMGAERAFAGTLNRTNQDIYVFFGHSAASTDALNTVVHFHRNETAHDYDLHMMPLIGSTGVVGASYAVAWPTVYVFGGAESATNGSPCSGVVQSINVDTWEVSVVANATQGRCGAAMGVWGGKLYILGGSTRFFSSQAVPGSARLAPDTAALYDLGTNAWSARTIASPPGMTACNVDAVQKGGNLTFIGDGGIFSYDMMQNRVSPFTINAVMGAESVRQRRSWSSIVTPPGNSDGMILVFGGYSHEIDALDNSMFIGSLSEGMAMALGPNGVANASQIAWPPAVMGAGGALAPFGFGSPDEDIYINIGGLTEQGVVPAIFVFGSTRPGNGGGNGGGGGGPCFTPMSAMAYCAMVRGPLAWTCQRMAHRQMPCMPGTIFNGQYCATQCQGMPGM